MYMSTRSLYTSLHTIYIHFHTLWSHEYSYWVQPVPLLNRSHSSSPPDYHHLSDTRVECFYMYHVTACYSYVDYIVLDPIAHGLVPITWSLWVSGRKGSETRSALQVLGKGTLYLLWQGSHSRCCCVWTCDCKSSDVRLYIWGSRTADHIEGNQHFVRGTTLPMSYLGSLIWVHKMVRFPL